MKLRIARGKNGSFSHYDVFEIESRKGMTVLDALFQIQDMQDPSISFRYACRGAICGSCGMLIDKAPRLACRTQIDSLKSPQAKIKLKPFEALTEAPSDWDSENEILVEPLPNFPLLNDLVVDMTKFYDALETLQLWADPAEGEEPRLQPPQDQKQIERYVGCIMCALCFGSCPINAIKDEYLGPAALAKAWRFYSDSRTQDKERFIQAAQNPNGAPLCDLIMNCVRACPKGVAPGGAIRKLKKEA
ncbi:MAG: succinate dehydrogenase/fumarate reductase iron-sulfur subunit [Candidatus Thorarchaeota archaeon]